jgi:O-antigen/teichoic acid export membrane protein
MRAWLAIALSLAATGCIDDSGSRLEERYRIAAVDGIGFVQAQGKELAPDKPCVAETCPGPAKSWDVSWKSGPETWRPIELAPGLPRDRILLAGEKGHPLIVARGKTIILAFAADKAVRDWTYFNYVLHAAASDAAGTRAEPFASWRASPVPQQGARWFYLVAVPIVWALFFFLYRIARRRGRAQPRAAEAFFAAIESAAEKQGSADDGGGQSGWNRAGFTRPLAGYITLVATMSFMVGGYLVLQWVLSGVVQPFPVASGLWETPWNTLIIFALFFEMGTNDASVKYFAEDRVARPDDALANFQFYVWWSFFQRLLQATLMGAAAIFWLPHSRDLAMFSIFVLLFAFKGLPSIAPLGRFVLSGIQRFDAQNVLELVESKILKYLAPIPFVLAGRAWGAGHPAYGEIFGAALGLAVGYLAMTLATLALGLAALRLIGVPIRLLFLAQFDWRLVKRQFLFGGKIALGAEPMFLVRALETWVITRYFTDYNAWQGIRDLLMAKMVELLFQFVGPFFGGSVPAVSEAYSAGKRRLTQYYVARFFQFGSLFSITIFSLMLAVGTVYIHSLGPQWARAVPFLPIALLYGLIWPAVWTSDNVLKGAGRPLTLLALMYTEYGVRFALIILLVPRIGFLGLLVSGLSATLFKAVLSWTVNHFTLVPFRISLSASLIAPAAAGLVNYLLWAGVLVAWAPPTAGGVLALICVAAGLSFLVTFFVAGLAGGYDPAVLDEMREATDMISPVLRPIARALSAVAHHGARLSPLAPRPLSFTNEALAEAEDLTHAEHLATGETSRPVLAPG